MLLQHMNYVNKQKASDDENTLLVEAWNSLKTKQFHEESHMTKEGITFSNLNTFLHVIHHIFPRELMKQEHTDSEMYESRPFGHLSSSGRFFV